MHIEKDRKMITKLMNNYKIDNKHQLPTRGIKHSGLNGYSSILARIKCGITGKENSPQSPRKTNRQPLCTSN